MNENQACEVPFVEQLRSVPKDFRAERVIQRADDGTPTGHQIIPVGFMFHRAADELERLASPEARAYTQVELATIARDAARYRLARSPDFRLIDLLDEEKLDDALEPQPMPEGENNGS